MKREPLDVRPDGGPGRASNRSSGGVMGPRRVGGVAMVIWLDEASHSGLAALARADRCRPETYLARVLKGHLAAKQREAGEAKPKGRK